MEQWLSWAVVHRSPFNNHPHHEVPRAGRVSVVWTKVHTCATHCGAAPERAGFPGRFCPKAALGLS